MFYLSTVVTPLIITSSTEPVSLSHIACKKSEFTIYSVYNFQNGQPCKDATDAPNMHALLYIACNQKTRIRDVSKRPTTTDECASVVFCSLV